MKQKGDPKTGGRAKGTPNKTTALLKDAILAAAELAGGEDTEERKGGLIGYLQAQAIANPSAFIPLLGKVLPLQIASDPDAPFVASIAIRYVDAE